MCSWVCHVKDILCKYGFAEVWENQEVDNESKFIKLFEQRCADTYAQSCHEQIQQSSRCRLYKELKENHDIEPYLQRNISCCTLRITFTTRCTRGDARSFFLYLQNVFVCTKRNFL